MIVIIITVMGTKNEGLNKTVEVNNNRISWEIPDNIYHFNGYVVAYIQ